MNNGRPVIGLNTTFEMDADGGVSATRPRYWEAIVRGGGVPVLLPQLIEPGLVEGALARVDGFVLIGGYDVSAERYGERALATAVPMDERREEADFALIEALIRMEKPTLAICLGYQELNVARGGTLYQDLLFDGPASEICHYSKSQPYPRHDVEVAAGSRLAEALGASGRLEVNSSHHQAVARIGSGLRVVAQAPDGLVEGLELEGHPFFLGVQWHPELMAEVEPQKRLFSRLIEQSGAR